jgi:hypothetical protein
MVLVLGKMHGLVSDINCSGRIAPVQAAIPHVRMVASLDGIQDLQDRQERDQQVASTRLGRSPEIQQGLR